MRCRSRGRAFFMPLLLGLALALRCQTAWTFDASEYLFLPTVTQGEREVDWHFGVGSSGATTRQAADAGIGIGMGVTARWYTELDLQYRQRGASGTALDAVEWENILQLAEPNQWPIDVGVVCEIERPQDVNERPSIRIGPLLQKEFGKYQANFNLLLGRHFRSSFFPATEIAYQSQIKYRYSEPFEFGLQAFGATGSRRQTWNELSAQVHRIGPVALGHFSLRHERSISYNAAFLVGATAHSPDRSVRVQLEYEF